MSNKFVSPSRLATCYEKLVPEFYYRKDGRGVNVHYPWPQNQSALRIPPLDFLLSPLRQPAPGHVSGWERGCFSDQSGRAIHREQGSDFRDIVVMAQVIKVREQKPVHVCGEGADRVS